MPSITALILAIVYALVLVHASTNAYSDAAALDARNSFAHLRTDHDELTLTDTVLLASVDGMFHAVNRTNGRIKWSMHPATHLQSSTDQPRPPLHNLVRSVHLHRDDDTDDADYDAEETYIIEPQSGQIFVLPPGASQTTPLEKLPFTIPKLVDISPFRLPVNGEQRMFLGRKETSLITLDIDTGAVVAIYDANSCVWNEKHHKASRSPSSHSAEEDDDEDNTTSLYDPYSDTFRPPITPPRREVIIGRTDYHLSVHVDGKGIIQTLTFSVYGPNNIDRDRQERWIKSPDGRYVQPLPDGRLFFFEPRGNKTELSEWVLPFPKPMYVSPVFLTSTRASTSPPAHPTRTPQRGYVRRITSSSIPSISSNPLPALPLTPGTLPRPAI